MSRLESYLATGTVLKRRGRPDIEGYGVKLLDTNWAALPTGNLSRANAQAVMGDVTMPTTANPVPMMTVVDDTDLGRCLQVNFTAGLANPNEYAAMFADLAWSLYPGGFAAGKDKTVTFEQTFKLMPGWEWPAGMKLPGLGGAVNGVDDGAASGGDGADPDMEFAFSARHMMYRPGSPPGYGGDLSDCLNRGCMYGYRHLMGGDGYGINHWFPKPAPGQGNFQAGVVHTLLQQIRMNTIGQANGIARSILDGIALLNLTNFPWRTNALLGPTHLWWHFFLGGSGNTWAVSQNQWLRWGRARVWVSL